MGKILQSIQRRIQKTDIFIDKECWNECENGGKTRLIPQWREGSQLNLYKTEFTYL